MRVYIGIDIDFDLESDGEILTEDVIDSTLVENTIMNVIGDSLDHMVDAISDDTGWCIHNLVAFLPETGGLPFIKETDNGI